MPDLGNAYVNIIPKAPGIEKNIEETLGGGASGAGEKAGASLGSSLMGTLGKIVSVAAVGKIVKDAFSAGGNLEQSFGGLDTIYGEASAAAKAYAVEAAQAGISANSYAEQAVAVGASLKQAFGGDTKAAMEAANTAIMDMADNSAKMGTDIGSIQAAYQGFAKQNYTMLDNLKLGYGGTKTEMQRLLTDAEKLTGVKYDINNLGDVYDAIHAVQGELGLTGVAANEASTTLSGSFGAMKASWENLQAAMTTGEGLDAAMKNLGTSVGNVLKNVIRMAGNMVSQLPTLFAGIFSTIGPHLLPIGTEIIRNLLAGITNAVGSLMTAGPTIILQLVSGIIQALPALIVMGSTFIQNLISTITSSLPTLLTTGTQIVTTLVNGIIMLLPQLISTGIRLISQLVTGAAQALPQILSTGTTIVMTLLSGLMQALPEILSGGLEAAMQFLTGILQNLPSILEAGISLLGELAAGAISAIPELVGMIPDLFSQFVTAFQGVDWDSLGTDIINGIIRGLDSAVTSLWNALTDLASQALQAAKDALGIGSPSKLFADQVGQWIPAGISVGIDEEVPALNKTVQGMIDVAGYDYMRAVNTSAVEPAFSQAPAETFGSGGDSGQGRLYTAIFNINGREFARAIFEDMESIHDDHGFSLIMA